jgi:Na+/H+ antiporter NhaD/arsenite permease-like protein
MMTSEVYRLPVLATLGSLLLLASVLGGQAVAQPADHGPAVEPVATQPAGELAAEPAPVGTEHGHDAATAGSAAHTSGADHPQAPSYAAAAPFVLILLCIALLPLIPPVAHWWHHNSNKLIVAAILAVVTLAYYLLRGTGFGHGVHAAAAGLPTVLKVLDHAVLAEYVPFIILLFSLYTICGGIILRGDLKAKPATNTAFLAAGTVLASFVGTTGASMLLIRPLLQTNKERKHVMHTVIFFIFLVSNIGGSLLPVGDPPLFLGYLKGVPFMWTLGLWPQWLFCSGVLLALYFLWDTHYYKKEPPLEHMLDETQIEPLRLGGYLNFVWLLGVILAVALIVPGQNLPGTNYLIPEETSAPGHYLREVVMLILVGLAWITSSPIVRRDNEFNFGAIVEVAVLFIGIFITMQAPIEILQIKGPSLGLDSPAKFFWATGSLSSFLDNAPTYVVFFSTANAMTHAAGPGILQLVSGDFIRTDLLVGISIGAVFMGANTYIGNGPNFMVKSIAEASGVKMPSFFGYMVYSVGILIPLFLAVTFIFLR